VNEEHAKHNGHPVLKWFGVLSFAGLWMGTLVWALASSHAREDALVQVMQMNQNTTTKAIDGLGFQVHDLAVETGNLAKVYARMDEHLKYVDKQLEKDSALEPWKQHR
jgi:hypothetical protein